MSKTKPVLGTLKPFLVRAAQAPLPTLGPMLVGKNGGATMTAAEEAIRGQTEVLRAKVAAALGLVIFNALNENSEKNLVVQVTEPQHIGKITMEATFHEFVPAAEAVNALRALESTITMHTPEEHLFEALAPIRKLREGA